MAVTRTLPVRKSARPGRSTANAGTLGGDSGRHSDEVEWLIDNEIAFARIGRAVRAAKKSVWMAQLGLDSDCVPDRTRGESKTFLDSLLQVASARAVDVRVLLNATLLLDTTKPLRRFMRAGIPVPAKFQLRGVSAFPQLLHCKIVIVDGTEAFIVGSPFVNDYWDTSAHEPFDADRPTRELAGRPLHDVSIAFTGPVVKDLESVFSELWGVGDNSGNTLRAVAAARGARRVEIVATAPAGRMARAPGGSTAILDSLLEGIASAERLIYIEHQYLSSRRIVDALALALERRRDLEIIMVLNQNPDITAYQRWQTARLTEAGLFSHPRVGIFSPWSAVRESNGRISLNQIFVHSKVVTVDDRLTIVGSANLDGVSLHSYGHDFTGWIGRRIFRNVRNFEVSAVVRDTPGTASPNSTRDLRMRLWAEHLGVSQETAECPSLHGCLSTWRSTARFNVEALSANRAASRADQIMQGHLLPYSREPMPRRQLLDLGIDIGAADIDLKFDPTWLNVRFSPNWIRNMFL